MLTIGLSNELCHYHQEGEVEIAKKKWLISSDRAMADAQGENTFNFQSFF